MITDPVALAQELDEDSTNGRRAGGVAGQP